MIGQFVNVVAVLICQFAEPPIKVLHISVRLRAIGLCDIASDFKLSDIEKVIGAFDGKDEVILGVCFELVDIESGMREAALLADDGTFLGEQVVNNKIL